ncbi:hypothetical protein [uncultured Mediterranean phage uvMED]|nr:hypothetical protein [uncultured Mediterranean phage uvMED]
MDKEQSELLLIEIIRELTEEEIKQLIKNLTFSNKLLSSSLLEVNHPGFVAVPC